MEFETPCEIPSVKALESARYKVRAVKAVPTGCAPAALWKHCAPVLAKHLPQLLRDLGWSGAHCASTLEGLLDHVIGEAR